MVTKMTVRLPDRVAGRLRDRSDADGLSINETLVRVLERGLDEPSREDEWWRALGDLIEKPPLGRYDPAAMRRFHATLTPSSTSILEDLDWVRGDATEA